MQGDVCNDSDMISAHGKDPGHALDCQASNRNQRDVADSPFPFLNTLESLRRPRHLLESRGIHGTQCDVLGRGRQGRLQFVIVVGTYSKLDAGTSNCGEVGASEVFLAKVYKVASFVDCDLPVVIDDKLGGVALADKFGCSHLLANVGLQGIFDSQLHELYAQRNEPLNPVQVVND